MPWYLIVKWWHLVAMVSWMAGVLYLLRLLVYHSTERGRGQQAHELLALMEKRLALYIVRPAMLVTWATGLGMVMMNPVIASRPWFMLKLCCVIMLSFVSEWANGYRKRLPPPHKPPRLSARTLKIINEVPTLLMIVIIGLVVLRPWP